MKHVEDLGKFMGISAEGFYAACDCGFRVAVPLEAVWRALAGDERDVKAQLVDPFNEHIAGCAVARERGLQ